MRGDPDVLARGIACCVPAARRTQFPRVLRDARGARRAHAERPASVQRQTVPTSLRGPEPRRRGVLPPAAARAVAVHGAQDGTVRLRERGGPERVLGIIGRPAPLGGAGVHGSVGGRRRRGGEPGAGLLAGEPRRARGGGVRRGAGGARRRLAGRPRVRGGPPRREAAAARERAEVDGEEGRRQAELVQPTDENAGDQDVAKYNKGVVQAHLRPHRGSY
mmetsp:Transcript_37084/g.112101  ORF Transcript_37084/g.112101 Transcript_37084/m.112101 type:complete len:219 (+) Transcript_37084:743-1399(+)